MTENLAKTVKYYFWNNPLHMLDKYLTRNLR
jgi:hypothetical protein